MQSLNAQSCPKVKEVRLEKIHFLSNPVGSGKTQAAIKGIELNDNESHIFVSPTCKLAEEIHDRMCEDLKDSSIVQNIDLITSETVEKGQPVSKKVFELIKTTPTNKAHVIIITTETFRNILPLSYNDKARYHVYLDEGIDVLKTAVALTGKITPALQGLLNMEESTGQIAVKPNCLKTVQHIAKKNDQALGSQAELLHAKFISIAKIMTCDLYDVFGQFGAESTRVVGMLKPSLFDGFKSVTMIMALFEQSPLAHYWRHSKGIVFDELAHECELFDTHEKKGKLISIYHALHPDDMASRSVLTETLGNEHVIRHVCKDVEAFFLSRGEAYCFTVNKYCKDPKAILTSGDEMPVKCAGMNHWEHHNNVAALSSSLPETWVKDIVVKLLGVDGQSFYHMWRMADTYQTIGRCCLRDRKNNSRITMVVLSEEEAIAINQMFKGSKMMGQLGKLPSIKQHRSSKKTRTVYTHTDTVMPPYFSSPHKENFLVM